MLVPVVNLAAVGMPARRGDGGLLRALARNPLVLACAAGLAWGASGTSLPELASRVLGNLGGASLALGLLPVGAALKIEGGGLPLAAAYWTALKLIALPACALAAGCFFGLQGSVLQLAVLMAAVPTAPSA